MLSDYNFVSRLKKINKRNIPQYKLKAAKQLIDLEEFDPDLVGKQSSACKSLCIWSIALVQYSMNFNKVKPKVELMEAKKAEVEGMEEQLEELNVELSTMKEQLRKRESEQRKMN